MTKQVENRGANRRDFLKKGTAAVAGAATLLSMTPSVHAAGTDVIRVGVIGCGNRGSGAAKDAATSAPNVKIVALADLFPDRIASCRSKLAKEIKDNLDVKDDQCFTGFNCHESLLKCDVNYVIIAGPPGFRPMHLKAAVDAGKNIFTEKPVAVDGPGINLCLDLYKKAKDKGLAIVAGTQRRHQKSYLEFMRRVHAGDLGELVAGRCYWNMGSLWNKTLKEKEEKKWTDMEWQIRNWLYFTWLSGDHIVEQHVHNLDVINWALQATPKSCVGLGGRQVRTSKDYGHIFDHHAVDFEYPNDVHVMSMCRQIENTAGNVSEALVGTKGKARTDEGMIRISGPNPWKFSFKQDNKPYVQEHTDLIESIRASKPLNELKTVTDSTLTAIMGRMATYTGQIVTWEQALESKQNLLPEKLAFGPRDIPAVPMPGITQLQ
jgi:predicted dehydrogenase